MMKRCPICGTEIERRKTYCGRRCISKAMYRRDHPHAAFPVETCIECGERLPRDRNANRRYCSRLCISRAWHKAQWRIRHPRLQETV